MSIPTPASRLPTRIPKTGSMWSKLTSDGMIAEKSDSSPTVMIVRTVNAPFFALAFWKKGVAFTASSSTGNGSAVA
jgi:hypothetical protein